MLRLAERPFLSCQGEGIQSGKPMVFIRTAGCNLQCNTCDTQFSWEKGFPIEEQELWDNIRVMTKYRWICITGGEPLLQDFSLLIDLILEQSHMGRAFTLETNGTIKPKGNWIRFVDLLTISPKLRSMGVGREKGFKLGVLQTLMMNKRCQLKFVCESSSDVLEAIGIVEQLSYSVVSRAKMLATPIIIQPQAFDKGIPLNLRSYMIRYQVLWEYVSQSNFRWDVRVLPQLHRLIYQQKRGV